jgi:two-component system phosphate regulon sensor histidine kinase PhoR
LENNAENLHILVVDDEQDIRDASERILTRMGFQVSKASRGDQAIELFKEKTPSIILLDLKMPGMDGMEVLKQVRQLDESVLIIVITGYATLETAIEAMKQGAYDFISKPFEPDQLRIIVNRASEKILLKFEAEKLAEARKMTLFDLSTEQSRIRTIIESLPNGLVVTNTTGQVVLMNPAFTQLVEIEPDKGIGETVDQYLPDEGLCNLILDISRGKHIDYEDIPPYEFALSENKYLMAKGQPVLGEKGECLGAVVNLVDITAMKVFDRLKSEFVAKVSHELRSPLATIHEQLAVVLSDVMETAPQSDQQILSRAKEKTHGLISLIGDLLDLSRIEDGVICQDPVPVHVVALLKNIVKFLGTSAEGKDQALSLEILEKTLPDIQADPLALESIFGNLIANAINYTQDGGNIKVIVDTAGGNIRVKVVDNGFGIEDKHQEKIFERFYRVKNDKTRYITGTGLGLPIVKELVQSLGGFIEMESEIGRGSTFTVLLPAGK